MAVLIILQFVIFVRVSVHKAAVAVRGSRDSNGSSMNFTQCGQSSTWRA